MLCPCTCTCISHWMEESFVTQKEGTVCESSMREDWEWHRKTCYASGSEGHCHTMSTPLFYIHPLNIYSTFTEWCSEALHTVALCRPVSYIYTHISVFCAVVYSSFQWIHTGWLQAMSPGTGYYMMCVLPCQHPASYKLSYILAESKWEP